MSLVLNATRSRQKSAVSNSVRGSGGKSLSRLIAESEFFYPLQDDAESNVVSDVSGNDLHGTLVASDTDAITTAGPGNDYPKALDFGAAGIYVAGPTVNYTIAPLALSFGCWLNTTQSGIRYFMGAGNSSATSYYCALNHSNGVPRFYFRNSDGSQQTLVTGSGNIDNGTWNHLFVTINPEAITLYLNGVATGAPAAPPSTNLTSNVFTIGGFRLPSATVADVDICGAGLWSRVLSASEVATLGAAA